MPWESARAAAGGGALLHNERVGVHPRQELQEGPDDGAGLAVRVGEQTDLHRLLLHHPLLLHDQRVVVVNGDLVEQPVFHLQDVDGLLGDVVVGDGAGGQGDGDGAARLVHVDGHAAKVDPRLDDAVIGGQEALFAEGPLPAEKPGLVLFPPGCVGIDVLPGDQLPDGAEPLGELVPGDHRGGVLDQGLLPLPLLLLGLESLRHVPLQLQLGQGLRLGLLQRPLVPQELDREDRKEHHRRRQHRSGSRDELADAGPAGLRLNVPLPLLHRGALSVLIHVSDLLRLYMYCGGGPSHAPEPAEKRTFPAAPLSGPL